MRWANAIALPTAKDTSVHAQKLKWKPATGTTLCSSKHDINERNLGKPDQNIMPVHKMTISMTKNNEHLQSLLNAVPVSDGLLPMLVMLFMSFAKPLPPVLDVRPLLLAPRALVALVRI